MGCPNCERKNVLLRALLAYLVDLAGAQRRGPSLTEQILDEMRRGHPNERTTMPQLVVPMPPEARTADPAPVATDDDEGSSGDIIIVEEGELLAELAEQVIS